MASRARLAVAAALGLLLAGGAPRAAAGEEPVPEEEGVEGSPILETLRAFFVGFEFKWGNLADPMKSKLHPKVVLVGSGEPKQGPLDELKRILDDFRKAAQQIGRRRQEQLHELHANFLEAWKRIRRPSADDKLQVQRWVEEMENTMKETQGSDLLVAISRANEADQLLDRAKSLFDQGQFGECLGALNEAQGKLSEDVRSVLQGHPPERPRVDRITREIKRYVTRAKAHVDFPAGLLRIQGVVKMSQGTVVILGSPTAPARPIEVGDSLDDLDPKLQGAILMGADTNAIRVKYQDEEILVPVSGGGF